MKIVLTGSVGLTNSQQKTITIETRNSSFELPMGKNLLDALLETGHPVDYQCRGGYCGTCRVEVTQGKVDYAEFPLAHLNSDEILPCCCRVTEPLKIAIERAVDDEQQGNLFE